MYHLINGRPGPVWLSIPVDIQGMLINEIDIPIIEKESVIISNEITNNLNSINELLLSSKRPIIIAGNGIKLGNCIDKFRRFIEKYNIPIDEDILYVCSNFSYYPYKFNIKPPISVLIKECSKQDNLETIKKLKELNEISNLKKLKIDADNQYLINYEWPGNVRELRNLIERIAILSPDTDEKISNIII